MELRGIFCENTMHNISKLALSAAAVILSTSLQAADSCQQNWQNGADYSYSAQSGEQKVDANWSLIRSGDKFLTIDGHDQITQGWEVGANGHVKMTQWFDADKRGIEYQPEDLGNSFAKQQYHSRYSVISPEWVAQLSPVDDSKVCEQTSHRRGSVAGFDIDIVWHESAKLPLALTLTKGDTVQTWQATAPIADEQRYQRELTARDSYFTIDKADVGDQESDPFFTGMKAAIHEEHHGH